MSLSQPISEFAGALAASRAELSTIVEQISTKEFERRAILQAPPHTDDIVAVFLRGLHGATAAFEAQLTKALANGFEGSEGADAVAQKRSRDILRLEASPPSANELVDRSLQTRAPRTIELSGPALAYFLRDRIEAEIPALVERLCPQASKGLTTSERQSAVAAIDTELDELRARREAIQADLEAARRAVLSGSN